MPYPSVSVTATRIWERLPQVYRDYDVTQDYPLLRFISLVADQLDDVFDILHRIDRQGPDEGGPLDNSSRSELTVPALADSTWLPWLAQMSGVPFRGRTTAELRSLIGTVGRGGAVATRAAMMAAAKTRLTGQQYVDIVPQAQPGGTAGGRWDVLVRTRALETVSGADVLDAILDAGAKPAGVRLFHEFYGSSWTAITTAYPTWTTLNNKTWSQIQSA